ncbi:MAG: DUF3795 domain-containing protein [Actinobacteria bacterium]|nr:DUF3795 domain-containing protein [Actinomycetota bacterium]MBU1945105.1 DUF3795 domain-containing protein [Actinomycetota bacterium]MBU2686444.1 DUF3795 domain-containing protein [Actinomycetota bacterium]
MGKKHLEKTAYCGLYCGDCSFGTGAIPDLARDLRKEMRSFRLEQAAEVIPFPEFKNYRECYDLLGALVKMRCGGCRTSARSRYCNIAKCAVRKKLDGCWECGEVEECKKLEFLEGVHGDAHKKNLRKIKKEGLDAWVAGGPLWYSKKKA